MPSEETLKYATWLENVALRCIYSEHYFVITTGHKGEFWPIVQNALGETICVLWAHVFGNRADDLHYTKFFARSDVTSIGTQYSPESVKIRLLSKIEMNTAEYNKFWQEVKNCRDQFVAHKQISATGLVFPHIDKCRLMMEEIRTILKELTGLWHQANPENQDLASWVDYYAWNPNKSLQMKCSQAFAEGIEHIAGAIGGRGLEVQGT